MGLVPPKALLFDWDNTLVDTWPCIGRATNITREAFGLTPWTTAEMRLHIAGSLRDTFPKIYGERWEEARDTYLKAFAAIHLDMLQALSDAERLLRAARGAGIYMGVVSNKTGSYLRAEATHLGWASLFGRLVGAQDAERDKPDPAPVHLALDGSGITPGPEVWFIGDAPIDAACGKAAGCTTIGVGPEPWKDPKADHHVTDCAALAALLAGFEGR
ncbi:MAG: HAD family hydrolase [Rhodospirillaceae bacterium]